MNKIEVFAELTQKDSDVRFVTNLIVTRHDNVFTKLRGLYLLAIEHKFEVRTAQFDADTLLVNGVKVDWRLLDELGELLPTGLGRTRCKVTTREASLIAAFAGGAQ